MLPHGGPGSKLDLLTAAAGHCTRLAIWHSCACKSSYGWDSLHLPQRLTMMAKLGVNDKLISHEQRWYTEIYRSWSTTEVINWHLQGFHVEEIGGTSKVPGIRWYNLLELLLWIKKCALTSFVA
jgi:hypothetical protein